MDRPDTLYWKWDNAITPKRCKEIIKSAKGTFEEAGIGDDEGSERLDYERRKTLIHWSNEPDLYDMTNYFGNSANKSGKWGLEHSAVESIQIGKYPKGGHYNWHVDGLGITTHNTPDNKLLNGKTRKISFVLWLNDNFEGGEFEFHNSHIKDNVIIPSIGTIICFPSWVMHRVKRVTKGTRYSAVSWLVGKPVK